mmetsp:Transcript_74072/g.178895  ORF Transcript_74072/g.178895 Transcript_74072/m.178895 type:complete len:219 (-) Transcript_74072:335-991(-)
MAHAHAPPRSQADDGLRPVQPLPRARHRHVPRPRRDHAGAARLRRPRRRPARPRPRAGGRAGGNGGQVWLGMRNGRALPRARRGRRGQGGLARRGAARLGGRAEGSVARAPLRVGTAGAGGGAAGWDGGRSGGCGWPTRAGGGRRGHTGRGAWRPAVARGGGEASVVGQARRQGPAPHVWARATLERGNGSGGAYSRGGGDQGGALGRRRRAGVYIAD